MRYRGRVFHLHKFCTVYFATFNKRNFYPSIYASIHPSNHPSVVRLQKPRQRQQQQQQRRRRHRRRLDTSYEVVSRFGLGKVEYAFMCEIEISKPCSLWRLLVGCALPDGGVHACVCKDVCGSERSDGTTNYRTGNMNLFVSNLRRTHMAKFLELCSVAFWGIVQEKVGTFTGIWGHCVWMEKGQPLKKEEDAEEIERGKELDE